MLRTDTDFTMNEVICPCGCGYAKIVDPLLERLQAARFLADHAFPITSWCRCKLHNEAVGGEPNSDHLAGNAVDIEYRSSANCYTIVHALMVAGFPVICIYPGHIHVSWLKKGNMKLLVWSKYNK